MREFSKTKLSLAVASALVGGMAGADAALAVNLNNNDGLGDAAIFQYYTAKGDWQTFFRFINTSDDAIVLKLRYREAANSREVLDFEVALSPHDMWSAWSDSDALGNGNGPGIRTNDTSCVFPAVDSGGGSLGEGWTWVDEDTNLAGALFKNKAFTGDYDDGGPNGEDGKGLARMSEGYLEVIGVAQYDCEGDGAQHEFCDYVSHGSNPKPANCGLAYEYFIANNDNSPSTTMGSDMGNVLATNAYLVNVPTGQGAGYDPDMLASCANRSLEYQTVATNTAPDLDSCTPGSFAAGTYNGYPYAVNQWLSDGTVAPGQTTTFQWADLDPLGPQFLGLYNPGDGNFNGNFSVLRVVDNTQNPPITNCVTYAETNVPPDVYEAAANESSAGTLDPAGNSMLLAEPVDSDGDTCTYALVASGGDVVTPVTTQENPVAQPFARIKQKGKGVPGPLGANQYPVGGGVDAVSWQFMRSSVINEWAASYNPDAIVTDYFTQWVLTFPTKHYYVDLQLDPILGDDISPTLVPLEGIDDAFAPFSQPFEGGVEPGTSCEPFQMWLYNREESKSYYTSPEPYYAPDICWETNVVNFTEAYEDRGLDSSFAITIPKSKLPKDYTLDQTAERGWAKMEFVGAGATNVGLSNGSYRRYGLPVTGFLFSVYNTTSAEKNHTTINAHKYEREPQED